MNSEKRKEYIQKFEKENLDSLRKILKDKSKDHVIIMLNETMTLNYTEWLDKKYGT